MVLSNGSLYYPEQLFHDILLLYFWFTFFLHITDLKSVEGSRPVELVDFWCQGKLLKRKIVLLKVMNQVKCSRA